MSSRPGVPPTSFDELNPSPRLLLGPGPINVDPRVLRAMSMPLLGQLQSKYEPLGFTLLGVNVEPDSAGAVSWLKGMNVDFPILFANARTGHCGPTPDDLAQVERWHTHPAGARYHTATRCSPFPRTSYFEGPNAARQRRRARNRRLTDQDRKKGALAVR